MSHELLLQKCDRRLVISWGAEIRDAKALVAKRYLWRGYKSALADTDMTFCALNFDGVITATASVRVTTHDEQARQLLCETHFPTEVRRLKNGEKSIEIVHFAAEPQNLETVANLLHVIVIYASCNSAKHIFAEVNPRHVRLYRVGFGFRFEGTVRQCERAGAPCVLMYCDTKSVLNAINSNNRNPLCQFKLTAGEVEIVSFEFEKIGAHVH